MKQATMSNKPEAAMHKQSVMGHVSGWFFGLLFFAIGLINIFWGNDAGYGIFIQLLSFIYFPPAGRLLQKMSGISIPLALKIILGIFILWTALGVAELFDKIDLMIADLNL